MFLPTIRPTSSKEQTGSTDKELYGIVEEAVVTLSHLDILINGKCAQVLSKRLVFFIYMYSCTALNYSILS